MTLTNAPGLVDMRPFIRNGWKKQVRYCYIFPLTGDIDERISKKSRWSVNKAKKAGIVVRQKWDMDLFWDLALNTYKKQGIQPPFSRELLFAFLKHIKNTRCGDMWIAETASGEKLQRRYSCGTPICRIAGRLPHIPIIRIQMHLPYFFLK